MNSRLDLNLRDEWDACDASETYSQHCEGLVHRCRIKDRGPLSEQPEVFNTPVGSDQLEPCAVPGRTNTCR